MTQKLSHLYTRLAIVYQYKQNKNQEESRRLAFVAVRNVLGGIAFFIVLTLFAILDKFFFSITSEISLSRYRLQLYAVGILIVFSYIRFSKKFLLPRLEFFDALPVSPQSLKRYNRTYIGLIVFFSIFGGLMFVFNRLLYIHF